MAEAYTYDPATGEYADADGTPVPASKLRAALLALIALGQARIAVLSQRLAAGRIDRLAWRTGMEAEVRQVATASAMLAYGGRDQMDRSALGWLGSQVRAQYDYLSGFALDLAQGLPLDGRFLARAQMYAGSGWAVYEAARQRLAPTWGMTEELNVPESAASCGGCADATEAGWVPLGTLSQPGDRDCASNCRCSLEYRAAAEVAA